MNITITAPTGSTTHGNANLLCTPPKWHQFIVFFLTNYLAHAATIISLPGQSGTETLCVAISALLIPSSGIMRALECFFRRPAMRTRNPLQQAAAAMALCMVVRVDKSGRKPKFDSSEYKWMADLAVLRDRVTVHGQSKLPDGYAFAYVPYKAPVEFRRRQNAAGDEITDTPATPKDEGRIAGTYNLPKALISLAQALWAIVTLYRARGNQIEEYGYAAFGLTVAPYAYMSIVNLAATCLTPEYPAVYMVRTSIMNQAESQGGLFEGEVGTLDLDTVTPGRTPEATGIMAWFFGFLFSIPPLIIIGALSRFNAGNSTSLERGFTMAWLVTGIWGGLWAYYLVDGLFTYPPGGEPSPGESSPTSTVIALFVNLIPLAVPPVGGFVVVGRMLGEFGVCAHLGG